MEMQSKDFARLNLFWLCLTLFACAPAAKQDARAHGGEEAVRASPRPAEARTPVTEFSSIAGQWDVARFEGYEPKRRSGSVRAAFADFGAAGVSLRIECNYSGRSGTLRDGRFVSTPGVGAPQTLIGCDTERQERDNRYFAFFGKNPSIEQEGVDRLRLFAEGSELILERPAIRRLHFVPPLSAIQASGG
jgi:hypothetical protein